ncbi:MAG: inner membrane CreD family protein, partial [Deltaproteobacteria bacterium]|nr:inner membrane CreD family protein [Deltaproteobacteria bacterium]
MNDAPQKPPLRISAGYLVAVVLIYGLATCGWLALGAITAYRSHRTDLDLRGQVGNLWGGQHDQASPTLGVVEIPPAPAGTDPTPEASEPAAVVPEACRPALTLRPGRTRARADLALDHRRKGLLWYSTYGVTVEARYAFENPSPCRRTGRLVLPLPAQGAIYDGFSMQAGGKELPVELDANRATAALVFAPGETREVTVRYRSRGLDSWRYSFGAGTARAKDFELVVNTDFDQVDFPDGALSPSSKQATDQGWRLTWRFRNILADAGIAVAMPHRINPGPLAAEISLFAPVSLAFFFFVLLLVSVMKQVRLHPVHYAMLAAAFFSFHVLLAYLVDLVPLWLAFSISSVTSIGLVVSYLRLAVGTRFAVLWAGGA